MCQPRVFSHASVAYHQDVCVCVVVFFLFFGISIGLISFTPVVIGVLLRLQNMSDQGNQHNNGPHQDKIFDNPAALCLALWAKNRIRPGGDGGWMHSIGSL